MLVVNPRLHVNVNTVDGEGKMKKLVFILCAAVALFSAPQWASALDTVYVAPGYGTRQVGNGGEFTLTASGSLKLTFQTFCIEQGEYLSSNATYNYVINSVAVQGGVGGPDPDPISKGTAYLYLPSLQREH